MKEGEVVVSDTMGQRLIAGWLTARDGYFVDTPEELPGEIPQCMHRWKIETPNGAMSIGCCRACGTTRSFRNSGIPIKKRQFFKSDNTVINTSRLPDGLSLTQNVNGDMPSEEPIVDPDFNITPIPE